ncbi:Fringe glycosyltransferase, partial [Eumeta japonica]
MVNTNCSASHQRKHLCCKMSVEYDHFLDSGKKWFCHFDDDNYVNVPRLVGVLQRYNPQGDWYLGRTSVYEPVKIYKKSTNKAQYVFIDDAGRVTIRPLLQLKFSFWFATGGAGFCLSRSMALKMLPIASGGRFISICERIRLPDDVSMGFVIEHLLKKNLTVVNEFHSHLEQMKLLDRETYRDQISFSYAKVKNQWNVVDVPGFSTHYDPT